MFAFLKKQLGKPFHALLKRTLLDKPTLDALKTQLLLADVGINATEFVITQLPIVIREFPHDDPNAIHHALQKILTNILQPCAIPLTWKNNPHVILMIGVNGVGKTTTIGKLAHYWKTQNKKVLLAAGDTFRAAATEQLQTWGQRTGAEVIAQHIGADSASVIFDALQAAKSRSYDVLLADTAGRLHNKDHLMNELQKIKRVLGKIDTSAPHDIWMVLDATTGQNGLAQAKEFHSTIGLTGLVITKLDGTAKGGIIFAIAQELQLPIYFMGIGEGIDDLRPFEADTFVSALLDTEE